MQRSGLFMMRCTRIAKRWRSAGSQTELFVDRSEAIKAGRGNLGASIAERITDSLGIERNVAADSGAVFLVGLCEELWKKFLLYYLESLGAIVDAAYHFRKVDVFFAHIYKYPSSCCA